MRQVNLFKNMERLVNMGMDYYKSDYFKYDKPEIIKNGAGYSYYWYVRNSGTELIRKDELMQNDTDSMSDAKYWLDQAIIIAEIKVMTVKGKKVIGTIKILRREDMERLIESIETEEAENAA